MEAGGCLLDDKRSPLELTATPKGELYLYERPFTDLHEAGLDGIFAEETADNLLTLIDEVNRI